MVNVVLDDTKGRLLEAAGEEFAEKGFQAATVRSIVRRAGTNIAAVNYHFGDKEQLYVAAVLEAHRRCTCAGLEPSGRKGTSAAQLREHVRFFLENVLAVGRHEEWTYALIHREMVRPTRASDALVRDVIRPRFERLSAIIRELRPDLDERSLIATVFSVVGQCMHYRFCRTIAERLTGPERFGELDVAYLTDHITTFTLRALGMAEGPAGASGEVAR